MKIPDCEADIIAECAAQCLAEGSDDLAKEIYLIALAEFPLHVPSLLALASLELKLSSKKDADKDENFDSWGLPIGTFQGPFTNIAMSQKDKPEEKTSCIANALHYALLALRMDDEDFDTW